MKQLSKGQKKERRKKSKQVFKRWLAKNHKGINLAGCFAFILIYFGVVDIILSVNYPEFFEWYLSK